jgi:hypothetical protein
MFLVATLKLKLIVRPPPFYKIYAVLYYIYNL